MHGEDDLNVRELLRETAQCFVNMAHGLAEVLATVCRHEDDALVREVHILQDFILEAKVILYRMMQRIDDRIARHEDLILWHVLGQQVLLGRSRRCEMQVGDAAGELAVHFLGERRVFVVRAQARLDVPHGRLMIVGCERARERRRRIAVYEHDIRLLLGQHFVEAVHGLARDVEERLPCRHDIEVIIRLDVEQMQHLIEHLAVLCCHGHHGDNRIRMLLQLQHDWCHLDRLRPRTEHGHDLDLLLFHPGSSLMRLPVQPQGIYLYCCEFEVLFIWKMPIFLAPNRTTARTTQTMTMANWLLTSVSATAERPSIALITYMSSTA